MTKMANLVGKDMLLIQLIVTIAALFTSQAGGAKILGVFWTPSKSHHMAGSPLLMELAKRGHEVHLISSFLDKNVDIPTYKQELLTGIVGEFDKFINPNNSILYTTRELVSVNTKLVDTFWQNEPIEKLIKTRPKYDAVIVLAFFNEYILSLGGILDTPVIVFSAMNTNIINSKFVANPNLPYESIKLMDNCLGSFLGRLRTVAKNTFYDLLFKYLIHPVQAKISRKYWPNMPEIEELHKNISLLLVNSHFSLEAPRPYVPNLILVGGYYMQEVKKLPDDIKKFLDSATDGAILFSMGTNLKIADNFKIQQIEAMMKVFTEISPLKIVFKSEIELAMASKNVLISNWLPQNDILAHPNIKLFISHCGRGGLTEAVIHGVPIMGIPFFADQSDNLDFAVHSGFAIELKLKDLTQENFYSTLKEILNNPKYAANVKKRSAVLRNQPVKPMDNAIWWVEHIIEHKGGEHLRNAGMDLQWYQLYMVDIMIFCLIVSSVCLTVSFFMVRWILRKLCSFLGICRANDKDSIKKKTN